MDRIYIVMDYVEHDLKALMETMKQPFLEGRLVLSSPQFLPVFSVKIEPVHGTLLQIFGSLLTFCHIFTFNPLLRGHV